MKTVKKYDLCDFCINGEDSLKKAKSIIETAVVELQKTYTTQPTDHI